jgi:hypothetical protein
VTPACEHARRGATPLGQCRRRSACEAMALVPAAVSLLLVDRGTSASDGENRRCLRRCVKETPRGTFAGSGEQAKPSEYESNYMTPVVIVRCRRRY